MSYQLPTIDLEKIRSHDGSERGGFEELAVELFRRRMPSSFQINRVDGAGGDGGVEAYVTIPGKGTFAVQAKYFFELDRSQLRQLTDSVETALTQHPDLVEYQVFVPFNRTIGRRGKTKGQLDKWKDLVERWQNLPNGSNVCFKWHGKTEIEADLVQPGNHDLLYYWFGSQQIDDERMDRVLNAALRTLNERYQPERHVDGDVGRELDWFVGAPSFDRTMEHRYVQIAEKLEDFRASMERTSQQPEFREHIEAIRSVIASDELFECPVFGLRKVGVVLERACAMLDRVNKLTSDLRADRTNDGEDVKEEFQGAIRRVSSFARDLRSWVELLELCKIVDCQCALISGDAGSGKSHLLAHCARQARARQQPALLLLGEQFLSSQPPLIQMCAMLGWDGDPMSMLASLNVAGSLAKQPALVFIDAVNESPNRQLWKSHLHALALEVQRYENVRLIVSCRSDFLGITMPADFEKSPPNGWGLIEHSGFATVLSEAVAHYFASYKIQATQFPPLLTEFSNPLFLDTFCRAFEGEPLPSGPITLQTVMKRRIKQIAKSIQGAINCDEYDVQASIRALTKKISENNGQPIPEDMARAVIRPHSPSSEVTRSLYTHLVSSGLIVVTMNDAWTSSPKTVVRFGFERFSDYFIAEELLSTVADVSDLRTLVGPNGGLSWLTTSRTYFVNRGVARALAILVAERFGTDLAGVLAVTEHRGAILADLLESLPWRSGASITQETLQLVMEASDHVRDSSFVVALLRVATIPDHPLNAAYLHWLLAGISLPDRDALWTLPVSEIAAGSGAAANMIEWAIRVPHKLVSDGQAALVATVLLWFGSSNRVGFRSRAGLAAIRLLCGRPFVAARLVEQFDSIDDPYVVERLYAVACGVAMRESRGDGLQHLASVVHQLVFATSYVRPHVLLRDYAQTVLETALRRGCLPSEIDPSTFRPPYQSVMPSIIDESKAEQIVSGRGWSRVAQSVRTETMGGYGDFGRYVMQFAVQQFSAVARHKPQPRRRRAKLFDARRARRWVIQRVKELGWSADLFSEHDGQTHDDRMTDDLVKVERIGKKYQWIALHELLGAVSDHYHIQPGWDGEPRVYKGPWQISQRDFDPSAVINALVRDVEDAGECSLQICNPSQWQMSESWTPPFSDVNLLTDRVRWVQTPPDDPIRLLTVHRGNANVKWLVLSGWWNWEEPRILRLRHGWAGQCRMWIHARSWLVQNLEAPRFIARLRKLQFWGHGVNGVALDEGWIGEYPYGAAFDAVRVACEEPDAFTNRDQTRHVRSTCEWRHTAAPVVPSPLLCELLDCQWSGEGATFVDSHGEVATSAMLTDASETPACVALAPRLEAALERGKYTLVWAVVGERRCWDPQTQMMVGNIETQFSGVYSLGVDRIEGGLTLVEQYPLPRTSE